MIKSQELSNPNSCLNRAGQMEHWKKAEDKAHP